MKRCRPTTLLNVIGGAFLACVVGAGEGQSSGVLPVPPVASTHSDEAVVHLPHPSWKIGNESVITSSRRLGEGIGIGHHSTRGKFHNLVFLLRFADHTSRPLPSHADISRLYNSDDEPDGHDDVIPTGSVRRVYDVNSYGAFTIDTTVVPWITLSHNEEYYADGNHGFTKFKEAIFEALTVLDNDEPNNPRLSQFMANFRFEDFDRDEDGALDGLGFMHSGYGAEFSGDDCYGAKNENRIWSHKGGLDWKSSHEDVRVNRYYVSSALRGKCHGRIVRMGVISHEIGHSLGLPDLYDGTFEGAGLGAYDFMSQSWGIDGTGTYPPILSAWTKVNAGWANALVIGEDGRYELEASTTSKIVLKITHGFPSGEYLLLENRQPNSFDSKIKQGGIAIYKVDENVDDQRSRGFPGQDGWPSNGKHYKVALLGADGSFDLEVGNNQADDGDLWHASSKLRELKSGNSVYPNTDSYQNGLIRQSGLRIYDFTQSSNKMRFRVEGIPSMPEPTKRPSSRPSSLPTSKPSTTRPTKLPSSLPTSSPPSAIPTSRPSNVPTRQPTSHPTENPTAEPSTSRPTHDCDNLCLTPIVESDCPKNLRALRSCSDVQFGDFCEADGECQTDQFLNNCRGYDVYRRHPCPEQTKTDLTADESSPETPIIGANDNLLATRDAELPNHNQDTSDLAAMKENKSPEDVSSPVLITLQRATVGPGSNDSQTSDAYFASGFVSAYTSTEGGTMTNWANTQLIDKPSSSLTAPPSTGPTTRTASVMESKTAHIADSHIADSGSDCPYYPGWNIGLNYCLKDCQSPTYMENNPIFEFVSLQACCSLHYQGKESCTVESLAAIEKQVSAGEELPSIHGRVWEDANGNNWQDPSERVFSAAMHGVMVHLYSCGSDQPSTGTRTSADGSYVLDDINPGSYYLRISTPPGYHLSKYHARVNAAYDSDFDEVSGRTKCFELVMGREKRINAGFIANDPTATIVADERANPVLESGAQTFFLTHNKSGSKGSRGKVLRPQTTLSHAKSFLRGSSSNVSSADGVVVSIHPTDDATIHSATQIGVVGREDSNVVGPQAGWRDEFLMKFDLQSQAIGGNDYRKARSAMLRLYSLSSSPSGGIVHTATSQSWDATSVNWSTAPEVSEQIANIGRTKQNQFVDVDVTGATAKTRDANLTLRVTAEESNTFWVAKYGKVIELRLSF